jgi:two-component system heavy metal sensor histidine kinase CusS
LRNKAKRHHRAPSIAFRMIIWFVPSAFVLIFLATGTLYWVLASELYQEDLRDLADNLYNARLLLRLPAPMQLGQSPDPRPSWAPQQQPEIFLRVLDVDAGTVIETPGMANGVPPPTKAELAAIGLPGGEIREVISHSGKRFLTMVVRVAGESASDRPKFMQVAMDHEHDEYVLARYRTRLWLVLSVSLVLCSLAGYLFARRTVRPIENISHTAARMQSTTLHERIEMRGLPAELARLAKIFNSMLDRLEQSFQHVSQFSDDVAHELRTPINNLRGQIEVALNKVRSGEEYREVLGSCLEEGSRISRLVQSLLFLARADSTTEVLKREKIDVGQELTKLEALYEVVATEAGINLRVSSTSGVWARLDRALFQQVMANLISNAIDHTPRGGSVNVATCVDQKLLAVRISDTGCGIAPEHLPRVFDRFYRVDRARGKSAENAGLGLAIVKSTVIRHGGYVEIDSEVGRGTEVRVLLPL